MRDSDDEQTGTDRTLDLYVRSLTATGAHTQQHAIMARLERLKERNVIKDFTVHIWGARVARDAVTARTDVGKAILEQIEAFRAWADRASMSLGSFFDSEETRSRITGEAYEAITLPTMTLAEYEGGTLRFVAPCTDGETLYTVADRLDELERGTMHALPGKQ